MSEQWQRHLFAIMQLHILVQKHIFKKLLTDQPYQQHFEVLGYTFCSNADRSSAFLEHHFVLLFPLKLDHFPVKMKL